MAIYSCELRSYSLSQNHNALKLSAYRAGIDLYSERTKYWHRYNERFESILDEFVFLPEGASNEFENRHHLWNQVEFKERRKDSVIARVLSVAMPKELSVDQQSKLARRMGRWLVDTYKVGVDGTLHSPPDEEGLNYYADLLFTTREIEGGELTNKTRILDEKATGYKQVRLIRETWAEFANEALEAAGVEERIDHRSYKDQGIDKKAQKKHYGRINKKADS